MSDVHGRMNDFLDQALNSSDAIVENISRSARGLRLQQDTLNPSKTLKEVSYISCQFHKVLPSNKTLNWPQTHTSKTTHTIMKSVYHVNYSVLNHHYGLAVKHNGIQN